MTITTAEETNNHHKIIFINHEEEYLSSSTSRLSRKWRYDLDIEAFVRDLPKV